MNPSFNYRIGIVKTGGKYRLEYYNSPYAQSEQELDDISAMLEGKTLTGQDVSNYKVVVWENLDDGKYEINVKVHYSPNHGNDGTFDQTFKLISIVRM